MSEKKSFLWLTGDATLALVPLRRRCEGAVGQVLGSLLATIKQQQQQHQRGGSSRSDLRRRRVQEMGHLAPGKTNVLLPSHATTQQTPTSALNGHKKYIP